MNRAVLPLLAVLQLLGSADPAQAQIGWRERAYGGTFGNYYSGYVGGYPAWDSLWDAAGTRIGLGLGMPMPGYHAFARRYTDVAAPDGYWRPSIDPYGPPVYYGYSRGAANWF